MGNDADETESFQEKKNLKWQLKEILIDYIQQKRKCCIYS